jgi:hypothetical protein
MKLDVRDCSRQGSRTGRSRRIRVVEAEVCMLVILEIEVGSYCGRHSLRVGYIAE